MKNNNNTRKTVACSLLLLVIFFMLIPENLVIAEETKTLTVNAKNCNTIVLKESNTDKIEIAYDKKYYDITRSVSKHNKNKDILTISGQGKAKTTDWRYQMVISIPKNTYGTIRVYANDAGVSLKNLSANQVIKGDESALAISVNDTFAGKLSANLKDCAVAIGLQTDVPKNHRFILKSKNCAVSVPLGWDKYEFQKEYTRGTGSKKLSLRVSNCALSVTVKNKL